MAPSQLVGMEEETLLGSDDKHRHFALEFIEEKRKERQWHKQNVTNPMIIEDPIYLANLL